MFPALPVLLISSTTGPSALHYVFVSLCCAVRLSTVSLLSLPVFSVAALLAPLHTSPSSCSASSSFASSLTLAAKSLSEDSFSLPSDLNSLLVLFAASAERAFCELQTAYRRNRHIYAIA